MSRYRSALLAAFFAASSLSAQTAAPAAKPAFPPPPVTRQDAVTETLHGTELSDPYRWLEDQEAPATREWIAEQNRYAEAYLSRIGGRDRIAKRVGELLKVDVYGLPTVRGGRYFFSKRLADQDQSVLYVRQSALAKDEVLVDPHPMSQTHTTSVNFLDVASDGRLIAYGVRQGGEDEVTAHLLEVDSRRDLPDVLPRARYEGLSIEKDRAGVVYSKQTKEGPRVFRHSLGTDPARDTKLFGDAWKDAESAAKFLAGKKECDASRIVMIGASVGASVMTPRLASKPRSAWACAERATVTTNASSIAGAARSWRNA